MKSLASLGGGLLALTLAALALHVPGADTVGSPARKVVFVGLLAVAVLLYFAAVSVSLRRNLPGPAVYVVLAIALALRLPVLFAPPFLSSDVFRYVWDGRVQAAGVNPYLYIPADPALAALRDDAIYPHINRADYAPTIYPPAAQIVFAAVGRAAGSVTAMKAAMVGFEVLAVLCLLRLLTIAGLPPSRVLIYAWNPLPVWTFAGNGHVDALAIGLIAAAMLLRVQAREGWAGMVFGAAILTKFFPIVIAPALWRARSGWRLATVTAAMIFALYAIYAGAGTKVFGFLHGYVSEESLDTGAGIWLLAGLGHFLPVPPVARWIYFAIVALGISSLGAWFAFRRPPPFGSAADAVAVSFAAAVLMAAATVAISPHYPWYFAWLALPCVIRPLRSVLWLSASPVLLYLNPFDDPFLWPSLVYLPAFALAVLDYRQPLALLFQPLKESSNVHNAARPAPLF